MLLIVTLHCAIRGSESHVLLQGTTLALPVQHVAGQARGVIGMHGTRQDQRRQNPTGSNRSEGLGNGPAKQVSQADRTQPQLSARKLQLACQEWGIKACSLFVGCVMSI